VVNNVNLCPQASLDIHTWTHIANLTHLVSLFIYYLEVRTDELTSFSEMLSNLTQLEILHLTGISNLVFWDVVSPV
jgi:hypothetical protein